MASFDPLSPLLDTRPGPPKLLNSASGGVTLYTSDSFSDRPPPNPFIGSPVQTARRKAFYIVSIAGVDITSKLEPYLISVRIVDSSAPTAEVHIDDRDGRLPIPQKDSDVTIALGWENEASAIVFNGTIQDVEYTLSRGGGGRQMTIQAWAVRINSAIKEPGSDNMGDGAPPGQNTGKPVGLDEWLKKALGGIGIPVQITQQAQKFKRDHWDRNNESPMQLVSRLAKQHGLAEQWGGDKLTIRAIDEGSPLIDVQWGVNLISLHVRPYSARSSWKASSQHFFDVLKGQWKRLKNPLNIGAEAGQAMDAVANFMTPQPAGDQMSANSDSQGGGDQAGFGQGHGRICINGEPKARYLSPVRVSRVRPGVDGVYVAFDAVEHIYSRQGYITWLDVITLASAASGQNVLEGYFAETIQRQVAQAFQALQPAAAATQAFQQQFPPLADPTQVDPGVPSSSLPTGSVSTLPSEQPATDLTAPVPNAPIPLDPFGSLGAQVP